ncbi:hypothetical protein [Amycolatopsis sp.]|uniref:hypothetical protein n=1 Tax=Amycolatopsis sp. TaxID=37632 RepID=UPI002C8D8011|nr:hypothetical protein [Amycolatopsis sp.]HVV08962.1 hypothetical protein [Amycolatopsis sp.]
MFTKRIGGLAAALLMCGAVAVAGCPGATPKSSEWGAAPTATTNGLDWGATPSIVAATGLS